MTRMTTLPIAGPTDHPQVGTAARNARSMMLLRDRIKEVARTALPPHKRRPPKGAGRWPTHIPIGSL